MLLDGSLHIGWEEVVLGACRTGSRPKAAKPGPTDDGATLRPLLEMVRHQAPICCVQADAEFD